MPWLWGLRPSPPLFRYGPSVREKSFSEKLFMIDNLQPAIELENVTVMFGPRKALHEVTGSFAPGSLTAVAGPNGAGKSTLLKVIAGVIKPAHGQVRYCRKCAGKIAYLPQTSSIKRDFPVSALHVVCSAFWPELGNMGSISAEHRKKALGALSEVGMEGFETRRISELSGGQFQRLLFARLMLQDARIILLDEPFSAVDAETTAKLIQILLRWHKEGRTIICVLHDLMMIKKYFPESFLLAGKCLGRGHTHALFQQKLLSFDLDMAELIEPETESKPESGKTSAWTGQ